MYMGWKAFFFLLQTSGQITFLLASSEHTLKRRLFEDYDREIRPVKLLSTTTNISVDSKIYSILSINEQEESIELIINTRLAWTDELLTWNPQDYDNCSKIRTLASNVWLPDFVFMNILDEVAVVPFDKQYLSIDSNGTIVLPMSSHSTLRCGMDITQFPFDTQACKITGGLWAYESQHVVLELSDKFGGIVFEGNSEFETVSFTGKTVIHTAADKNVTFSEVHFTLKLKRRPEYYIFVLVVPSFLLTSMCIIGIFTPNSNVGERNEKMTLGLTTLLSMAVILNIAADEMPKSAKGLPLLGYYILYEIALCSLATIFSTAIIFVHERAYTQDWHPPAIIYWIANIKPCTFSRGSTVKATATEKINQAQLIQNTESSVKAIKSGLHSSLQSETSHDESVAYLKQLISIIEEHQSQLRICEDKGRIWITALDTIDLCLLIGMLLFNCSLTLKMLF